MNNKDGKDKKVKTTTPDEPPPPVPEGWTRCHAYLKQKQRFCRQLPLANKNYCGNHQEFLTVTTTPSASSNTTNNNTNQPPHSQSRIRIPCPLDSSHTIYADMVDRHLKICPKATLQRQIQGQPFYQHNVNAGGYGTMESTNTASNGTSCSLSIQERAKALARRVLVVHQQLFGGPLHNNSDNNNDIAIAQLSLPDIESSCSQLPLKDYSRSELQLGLAASVESYHIRSGGPKHLQQQASLLGHLKQALKKQYDNSDDVLCNARDILILELGAGRGMLGLVAAGAFAAATKSNDEDHAPTTADASSFTNNGTAAVDLIMMERAGTRSKADTILRNHKSTLEGRCLNVEQVRNWQRLQCDLAHVHMPTVLELHSQNQTQTQTNLDEGTTTANQNNSNEEKETCPPGNDDSSLPKLPQSPSKSNPSSQQPPIIMAIAKHLCGAGTDLALKALYPIRHQLHVCLMATCCHGVCTWEHYVGREYLTRVMLKAGDKDGAKCDDNASLSSSSLSEFGQAEFEMMRLWSSGTVKDDSNTGSVSISNTATESTSGSNAGNKSSKRRSKRKQNGDESSNDEHHSSGPLDPQPLDSGKVVSVGDVVKSLKLTCGVQGLGRACQRLLDYGRKQYLEQVLFAGDDDEETAFVDLCHYVPSIVTPQNAVLMASRNGGPR